MSHKLVRSLIGVGLLAVLSISAHASPNCLRDQKPYALAEDTVRWTMSIAPGKECIQGLRWSYMQIFSVSISKAPTKGKIVIVGSGFRYFADSENDESDGFTLVVVGKNRRDAGKSTLEIAVNRSHETLVSELPH